MWWYWEHVVAVRRWVRACYSVEAELAFVALVLIAWQALRIPLEGSVAESLDHAGSVLRLEEALGLDIEASFIARASESGIVPVLAWLYANIHVPVLFAFMAAARLLAPERYPRLRTIFVLSFVPAIVVIGLYPLAPPRWLPSLGLGPTPTQFDLETSGALFHNETAAAASQHFGFAVFVAAAAVWLFPRSRLASAAIAYPVLVFLVIVCTGHHYVLDCVVGTLTFVVAALCARVVHGRSSGAAAAAYRPGTAAVALGCGLVAWGTVSLDVTELASWSNIADAVVLMAGIAAILSPRLGAKEAVPESG
jgi:PAP2 superfamily